jgi:hypothetical protein
MISLISTVAKYKQCKNKRILILAPKTTIYNWRDEFIQWVGPFFELFMFYFEGQEDLEQKIEVLERWFSCTIFKPGVFLMGELRKCDHRFDLAGWEKYVWPHFSYQILTRKINFSSQSVAAKSNCSNLKYAF